MSILDVAVFFHTSARSHTPSVHTYSTHVKTIHIYSRSGYSTWDSIRLIYDKLFMSVSFYWIALNISLAFSDDVILKGDRIAWSDNSYVSLFSFIAVTQRYRLQKT